MNIGAILSGVDKIVTVVELAVEIGRAIKRRDFVKVGELLPDELQISIERRLADARAEERFRQSGGTE